MSQFSKVLAQLNAIFYSAGLPEKDMGIGNYLDGTHFYNKYYNEPNENEGFILIKC